MKGKDTMPGLSKMEQPWYHSWKNAYRRCTVPSNNRYQYYGAKGIGFELSFWGTGWLYTRDKANQMKKPQIHRRNPNKGYNLQNCEFVEASEHNKLTHLGKKRSKESRLRMSLAGGTQFGENHPNSKLTYIEVRDIRKALKTNTILSQAKQYGVSQSLIHAIKQRKIWKR